MLNIVYDVITENEIWTANKNGNADKLVYIIK